MGDDLDEAMGLKDDETSSRMIPGYQNQKNCRSYNCENNRCS